MNILSPLIIAFSMYTKIPMPHIKWNEKNMKYVMCYFPLTGVILCVIMCGIYYLLNNVLQTSTMFTAIICTLIPLLYTGGIHFDGYLDTMDAINSYKPKDEKLKILSDPHVGAFAVIHAIIYILLTFAFYLELQPTFMPLIALTFILSRSLSAFSVVTFKTAKENGLVHSFNELAKRRIVRITSIIFASITTTLMIIYSPVIGILTTLIALLTLLYYKYLSYTKFGGITGDLAGYFLQLCELLTTITIIIIGRLL